MYQQRPCEHQMPFLIGSPPTPLQLRSSSDFDFNVQLMIFGSPLPDIKHV